MNVLAATAFFSCTRSNNGWLLYVMADAKSLALQTTNLQLNGGHFEYSESEGKFLPEHEEGLSVAAS